jgi:hypothetical protein
MWWSRAMRWSLLGFGAVLMGCYPVSTNTNVGPSFPLEPGASWSLRFERDSTVVYSAVLTRGVDQKPTTDDRGSLYINLQSGLSGGVGILEGQSLFLAVHLDGAHAQSMGCRLPYPLMSKRVPLEVRGFGFLKSNGKFVQDTRLGCVLSQ